MTRARVPRDFEDLATHCGNPTTLAATRVLFLSAVAMMCLLPATSFCQLVPVADPLGDAAWGSDVIAVDAAATATSLNLKVTFASVPDFAELSMRFDTDQNTRTENFDTGFFCGLGAEFALYNFSGALFVITTNPSVGGNEMAFGATEISGNTMTFTVPLSVLVDDGVVNMDVAVLGNDYKTVDRVPDDPFAPGCRFLTSRLVSASVDELLNDLVDQTIGLNLQQGISNRVDAKLSSALGALDDLNEDNDIAAVNSLQAFIEAVETQSGTEIDAADAADLIAAAQEIIDLLTAP